MKNATLRLAPALVALLAGCAGPKLPETAAFVQACQNPDGGFAMNAGEKSGLGPTSAAIRALKMLGATPKEFTAAKDYVAKCAVADTGAFAPTPGGEPAVFSTAVGLMAQVYAGVDVSAAGEKANVWLTERAKSFDDVRIAVAALESVNLKSPKNAEWIARVEKMQNPDGTFGEGGAAARATGGSAVALLRMGAKLKDPAAVLKTLRAGQQADGGWSVDGKAGSDGETTYRVMRGFHMMKEKPDVERLRGFLAKCRNADGGYGPKPGEPSTVSGTYYALTVMMWIGDL